VWTKCLYLDRLVIILVGMHATARIWRRDQFLASALICNILYSNAKNIYSYLNAVNYIFLHDKIQFFC
jgi:hypothetical protein